MTEALISAPELGRALLGLWRRTPAFLRLAKTMLRARPESRGSLASVLERTAQQYPDQLAIRSETRCMTWRELDRSANRVAHTLHALGLRAGDSLGLLMENRVEYLVLVCAASKLGAAAALLNTHLRGRALLHTVGCAPPRLFVVGEELIEAFRSIEAELDPTLPILWARDGGEQGCPAGWTDLLGAAADAPSHPPVASREVRMGQPAFYVFTSGTTGLPKASPMSHYRWVGAGLMFGELCLRLGPVDRLYAPLPLYHNQAITLCWAACVRTGAALVIRRRFSAGEFWEDCRRSEASVIAYIGEIARYLLNQPPGPSDRAHRVRKMVGVGLRPELWAPFKSRFGIEEVYEYYSASELNAGFFNVLNLDRTVGFCPGPWALVAWDPESCLPLRDHRGYARRLARGQEGLLLLRVTERFRFEGYTDEQATRDKLLRNVFEPGDLWVHTGDLMRHLGFGHLQFVDRIGDTFRWKSENVATTEVEAALCTDPSVAAAAVYGVSVPHAAGRAGMAAVVPTNGAVDRGGLLARLRAELPDYAVPVFLRQRRHLEVTGTFKHKKSALRAAGFDPSSIEDPLFVWLPGTSDYTPLTPELFRRIQSRRVAL